MAVNKILKGMIDNFKKDFLLEDMELSKAYEYFSNYLLVSKLHPDAFSDVGDLHRVVVDEKSQFGLDAIAFIVNGNLVVSKEDISCYAKSKTLDVQIIFIQTKTEEKCDTGDLLKTIQATKNFLMDFDAVTEKNENILNAKEIYDALFEYDNYRYCSGKSPACYIYYVTAAKEWDESLVDSLCRDNEKNMLSSISDIKSFDIRVFGSQYMIGAYNEIENNAEVQVYLKNCITLDKINDVQEVYIGYLTGDEYLKIITNKEGELRRRIFYENVRDYQGPENAVNAEIRKTIEDDRQRDKFVLLNNGVTLITKSVVPLGGNMYELRNFQVVNGCQTSNEIYNARKYAKDLLVPVKIIYTTDADLITSIVRATNRQSPVPEEAFVALERYHKELQMLIDQYSKDMPLEIFYERRSGEQDTISNKLGKYQKITLHGLIRAITSVYFQDAHVVYNNNPANILRNRKDKLFCKEHNLESYYIASYLFVEFVYLQQKHVLNRKDYSLRFYIMMIVRSLVVKSVVVPELSSKEIQKQNADLIKCLKNEQIEKYYLTAKEIVGKAMEDYLKENADKNAMDARKSADFCKLVNKRTQDWITHNTK